MRLCARKIERREKERVRQGKERRAKTKEEEEGKRKKELTADARPVLCEHNLDPLLDLVAEDLPQRVPDALFEPRVKLDQAPVEAKDQLAVPVGPIFRIASGLDHGRRDRARREAAPARADNLGHPRRGEAVGVVDQRSREAQLARQDLADLAQCGVGFDARVGDEGKLERRHDGRVETVVGVERPRGKALEQDLRVDQVQEDVARHFSEVCSFVSRGMGQHRFPRLRRGRTGTHTFRKSSGKRRAIPDMCECVPRAEREREGNVGVPFRTPASSG